MTKQSILTLVTLSSLVLTPLVQAEELLTAEPTVEMPAPVDEGALPVAPAEPAPVVEVPVSLSSDIPGPVEVVTPELPPVSEDLPSVPTEPTPVPETTETVAPVVTEEVTPPASQPEETAVSEQPAPSSSEISTASETQTETSTSTSSSQPSNEQTSRPTTRPSSSGNQTGRNTRPGTSSRPVSNQSAALETPAVSPITEPIVTNTGVTIISTQDSQVIVQRADGRQEAVSAESIGAVVNQDRTVTVITKEGQKKTLPSTGEKDAIFYSLLGMTSLLAAGLWGAIARKLQ